MGPTPERPAATARQYFQRLWGNWTRFWFAPSEPYTLALMRIIAGVVVCYVHLSVTRDLLAFYGSEGWVDTELSNKIRYETPHIPVPANWEDLSARIMVPADQNRRRILIDWMTQLPNSENERRQTLRYLIELPEDIIQAQQGLSFVRLLSEDRLQRDQQLEKMIDLPDDPKKRDERVPPFLQDKPLAIRKIIRDDIVALLGTFANPEQKKIVMNFLFDQTMAPLRRHSRMDPVDERARTINYAVVDLPDDPNERRDVLGYLFRWGIDPRILHARGVFTWSLWFHVTNPIAMYVLHFAMIGAMVMFTLGLFTRVTSVLTWMAALCYIHRTGQVLFGQDTMMNLCLLYLMVSPCGAVLSLDRWRARRRAIAKGEPFPERPEPTVSATFATRLLQINFCFIYMASGLSKLKGEAWWNHTALWLTVYNPEFSPTFFAPYRAVLTWLCYHRWLWAFVMSGGVAYTLVLEIGFPFLVWRPRLRAYLVVAAILLHTGIAILMGLNVFGLFMLVLLMSYIPPTTVRQWLTSRGSLFLPKPVSAAA
jgi:hypothetical protein